MPASWAFSTTSYTATLRAGEAAVHREGAGDVGGVIAPLAARVDEEQVPVLHPPPVLVVVEDAGVGAGGHDGGIGVAGGAALAEDELQRRLHLVLVLARPREAHGLDVGVAADLAGAALAGQLLGRAAQAQLVEDGPGILDARGGREAAHPDPAHLRHQARDAAVVVGIAQPVHEAGPVDRVLAEPRVQLVDGVGGVGAVGGDGALHARAAPVQISCSRSRGRTKRTKRSLAWEGLKTATASGSSKPVRK